MSNIKKAFKNKAQMSSRGLRAGGCYADGLVPGASYSGPTAANNPLTDARMSRLAGQSQAVLDQRGGPVSVGVIANGEGADRQSFDNFSKLMDAQRLQHDAFVANKPSFLAPKQDTTGGIAKNSLLADGQGDGWDASEQSRKSSFNRFSNDMNSSMMRNTLDNSRSGLKKLNGAGVLALADGAVNVGAALKEALVDPIVADARAIHSKLGEEYPLAYQAAQMHPVVGIPAAAMNYADAYGKNDTEGMIKASLSGIPIGEKAYQIGKALPTAVRQIAGNGGLRAAVNNIGRRFGAGETAAEAGKAGYDQGQKLARGGIVHGPGTQTSDSVPVHLSRDEAVLPAKTVDALGGPQAIGQLIEQTTGKPPAGLRAGGGYYGGMVDDFGNMLRSSPSSASGQVVNDVTGQLVNDSAKNVIAGQQNARPMQQAVQGVRQGISNLFDPSKVAAPDYKALGKKVAEGAKSVGKGILNNVNTAAGVVGAGDDLGAIAASDADLGTKISAGLETAGNVAGDFLIDRFAGPRGKAIGLGAGAADAYMDHRPITAAGRQLTKLFGGTGETALDKIHQSVGNEGPLSAPRVLYKTAQGMTNPDPVAPSKPAAPVAQTPEQAAAAQAAAKAAEAEAAQTALTLRDPGLRAGTPEEEFARQQSNMGRGGPGAAVDRLLSDQLTKSKGLRGANDEVVNLYNRRNELAGNGIQATRQANGNLEFSGNGGTLYMGADGKPTDDWSKTKAYADAIDRNKADQAKLASLAQAAGLRGDKEAVYRLGIGDGNLAKIGQDSLAHGQLMRDGESGDMKAQELLTRRAEKQADLQARREENASNRDVTIRGQNIQAQHYNLQAQQQAAELERQRVAAQTAAANRKEDIGIKQDDKIQETLKDYAKVNGQYDPEKHKAMNGLINANFKRREGESPDEFTARVIPHLQLRDALEGARWWTDFATPGGYSDRSYWSKGAGGLGGLAGSYKNDSTGQWVTQHRINSLSKDQQDAFYGVVDKKTGEVIVPALLADANGKPIDPRKK